MTGLRFLLVLAALPALGWPFARLVAAGSRRHAWAAAAPLAALLLCGEMVLASAAGVRWSAGLLLAPFAAGWAVEAATGPGRKAGERGSARLAAPAARFGVAGIAVALAAFAAGTARATCTDLLLFWGPKAQRFASVGRLDFEFLGARAYYYMHPDYPPLLTLHYAAADLAAGRFAWGASLLTLPVCLLGSAAVFWAMARGPLGEGIAADWTALLVALQGLCLAVSMTAGGGEPFLLLFEVVALSALVFGGEAARTRGVASVALAAGALCKVEGLVFALLVALAFGIEPGRERWRRSLGRMAELALPALAGIGAWVLFCAEHALLDTYRGGGPLHLEYLGTVLRELPRQASYETGYLPWLVVTALGGLGLSSRLDWRPALVAFGFLGFTVYLYLHMSVEPTQWIGWSASRVLLTPLNALFFWAASGAARNEKAAPGSPGAASEIEGGVG